VDTSRGILNPEQDWLESDLDECIEPIPTSKYFSGTIWIYNGFASGS
jgi:hypothetical protein